MSNSLSGSFAFRLAMFLIFAFIGIAGFSSLAWQRFNSAAQQQNNASSVVSPTVTPTPPPVDNIDRATSEPYTGDLSIFEDAKREKNLQINRVMDLLGVKAGVSVADIGAGSGWFTVRAARRVREGTAVYAVEINQEYLDHIARRAEKESLPSIKTVLGKEDDPALPENSVDVALILKTYHEIAQPVRFLKNLKKSLRQGARLGIIDRNGKGNDHGIDEAQVVKEAEQAGFKLVNKYDFVKPDGMDYFIVFQAR